MRAAVWHSLLAALLLIMAASCPAAAAKRIALVVGIDGYESLQPLRAAVSDARTIGSALENIGFAVTLALNVDRRELNRRLAELDSQIEPGDEVFFFFAGHGVAVDGENYILPRDMPLPLAGQENMVRDEAIGATQLIQRIQREGARVTMVVLDACRNNPFEQRGVRSIGATRGLARMDAGKGVFVLFSAGIGETALDTIPGRPEVSNSVFTHALAPLLATPGMTHIELAKRVQAEVERLAGSIGHIQTPAYYDQITGEIVLLAATDTQTKDDAQAKLEPPLSEEARAWSTIRDSGSCGTLAAYVTRFGATGSIYVDFARARQREIGCSVEASTAGSVPKSSASGASDADEVQNGDSTSPPKKKIEVIATPPPQGPVVEAWSRLRSAVVTVRAELASPSAAAPLGEALAGLPADHPLKEFFTQFGSSAGTATEAFGSGIVIDSSGLVLTAERVIRDATSISVRAGAGAEPPLRSWVVGIDRRTGLAVLKIDGVEVLPHIKLDEAVLATVGMDVVALSADPDDTTSIKRGRILALDGDRLTSDAPLTAGHVGGPLLAVDGGLAGIVLPAPASDPSRPPEAAWAVRADVARFVAQEILQHGEVRRGYLGVHVQNATGVPGSAAGLEDASGAIVVRVVAKGPADEAGIREGDVIRRVGETRVGSARDLSNAIADAVAGSVAVLSIGRDGQAIEIPVTLGRLWQLRDVRAGPALPAGQRGFGSLLLAELNEELRREHAIDASVRGLLVVGIAADSDAERKGLRVGDTLALGNGNQPLGVLQDLDDQMIVAYARRRDQILVQILTPKAEARFAALSLYDLDGPYRGSLPAVATGATASSQQGDYQVTIEHDRNGRFEEAATALIAGAKSGDAAIRQLIDNGATELKQRTREAVQRQLRAAGRYAGSIDGIFGKGTRQALADLAGGTP